MKYFVLVSLLLGHVASAANKSIKYPLNVRLPKPKMLACKIPGKGKPEKQNLALSCLTERAKYKCTSLVKPLKGIGSYYGKGDLFTDGATKCEKPFYPKTDKILALQDSLISNRTFVQGLCGRKAVVIAYEPDTGRCVSTEVEVSDIGNLGARDHDRNNATRDTLKRDVARVGKASRFVNREVSAPRAFDLSYAAAKALHYADDLKSEDRRKDGTAYMEVTICQEYAPARLTPGATKALKRIADKRIHSRNRKPASTKKKKR